MKKNLFFLLSSLLTTIVFAQQVPSADQILKEARGQAAKENKNVILIFHASWCGWCHKMDSSLSDAACKAYFDRSYVISHVDIDETPDHKQEENPGAYELRKTYRGEGQGLPYWVIL